LKKPAGSVQFYKQKTEPNRIETGQKPSQNQKKQSQNRAKPVWTGFFPKKPNRNRSVWPGFGSILVFLKKKFGLVTFFDKNRTEPKMITPIAKYRGRFNFLYLYLLVNCHHKKKRYYWPWSHILIFMYFNDNN